MKKTISILLVLVLCIALMALPVSASEAASPSPGATNGDVTSYIPADVQLQQYLAQPNLTPAERQAAVQKFNLGQLLASGQVPLRATRATAKTLSVTFYSQTNDYYCGPASVKQTVQYLNGSSSTQATIASALGTSSSSGTDTNTMATYLNDKTDKTYEVLWWWADANALSSMVIADIDASQPIIAHVIINTKGDWLYTTSGHYMNYNGYSSSGAQIAVTDPYADRYNDADGKYSISASEAERVTDRIIW